MASRAKDAVVSVRISEEEQSRLRQLAESAGKSVSELVRSLVVREVNGHGSAVVGRGTSVTTAPTTSNPALDRGLFWDVKDGVSHGGALLIRG